MAKKGLLIVADYSQKTYLNFDELCEICQVESDMLNDLIRYEIVHPFGGEPDWMFDLVELNRVKKALRLQHDLEMNLAGVAVVLDLLDELDQIQSRMRLLEKHFLK